MTTLISWLAEELRHADSRSAVPMEPTDYTDQKLTQSEISRLQAELAITKAMINALVADLRDYKLRFCDHHATPGGCPPGCPVCRVERLQLEMAK